MNVSRLDVCCEENETFKSRLFGLSRPLVAMLLNLCTHLWLCGKNPATVKLKQWVGVTMQETEPCPTSGIFLVSE